MTRSLRGVIVALLAVAIMTAIISPAAASSRWGHSRVSLRNSSRYGAAVRLGSSLWSRLKVGVRFAATSKRRADVVVRSGDYGATSWAGIAETQLGLIGGRWRMTSVQVRLNDRWLRGASPNEQLNVVTHELGHALGLDHDSAPCAVMNATGLDASSCPAPPRASLERCGVQWADFRALQRIYGGRSARYRDSFCASSTPDDGNPPPVSGDQGGSNGPPMPPPPPDQSGGGSNPPPPPTPRTTVYLSNSDDDEQLYLNGQLVGDAPYGEARSFDLGTLGASDTIVIAIHNGASGYTWGIDVDRGGNVLHDWAGTVGQYGANSNDLAHENQVLDQAQRRRPPSRLLHRGGMICARLR